MTSPALAAAWPAPVPLALLVVAATLYTLGGRRRASRRRRAAQAGRSAAFWLALLAVAVAVDSPLDPLADRLFSAHMAQHLLLLTVAPPLIVLSAPWARLWQPLPLGFRRAAAKWALRSRGALPLRLAARGLAHPLASWTLFSATLVTWHVPALYDLTLRSPAVHDVEHATFLATGLLFWGAVIDSPPFRPRIDRLWRAAYVTTGMLVGWVLALVLAFASSPLYAPYAALHHRPGGLSALADQQLAAGVMWVPGSLAYTVAAIVFFYRWLEPESPGRRRLGLAGGR